MNLTTIFAIAILALIVSLAVRYIVREKRRGTKCIGCPYADSCPSKMFDPDTGEYRCGHSK